MMPATLPETSMEQVGAWDSHKDVESGRAPFSERSNGSPVIRGAMRVRIARLESGEIRTQSSTSWKSVRGYFRSFAHGVLNIGAVPRRRVFAYRQRSLISLGVITDHRTHRSAMRYALLTKSAFIGTNGPAQRCKNPETWRSLRLVWWKYSFVDGSINGWEGCA